MRNSSTSRNIKFALIVFIGLIIFCIAQLTWWAIFQVESGQNYYNLQVKMSEQKIRLAVDRINSDFSGTANLLSYAVGLKANSLEQVKSCFDNVLVDPMVVGYFLGGESATKFATAGVIDSTFYFAIGEQGCIYFDPEYPTRLIESDIEEIVYTNNKINSGDNQIWVSSDMFSISPKYLALIDKESHKRTKMIIAESGFFLLIMILGAFLIYRTLQRSEELTFRQVNFIQAVTHEFRTPLTSIRLYLETLQAGKVDNSRRLQLYDNMLADCDRLENMVDDVLKAGRFSRKDYRLNLTETDLVQDIEKYLFDMDSYIKSMKATVTTQCEEDIIVLSDYVELGRAIRSIVENGIKYSPPERRVINLSLLKERHKAVIKISDKGFGMPKAEQNHVFDRFYRIGNSSTYSSKGTGLGLYLVREIIKAHYGKVAAFSAGENKGTTITIYLPLKKDEKTHLNS